MNIGSMFRRAVTAFGRKGPRSRPVTPTTGRHTSSETQAAKGIARKVSKKL